MVRVAGTTTRVGGSKPTKGRIKTDTEEGGGNDAMSVDEMQLNKMLVKL